MDPQIIHLLEAIVAELGQIKALLQARMGEAPSERRPRSRTTSTLASDFESVWREEVTPERRLVAMELAGRR